MDKNIIQKILKEIGGAFFTARTAISGMRSRLSPDDTLQMGQIEEIDAAFSTAFDCISKKKTFEAAIRTRSTDAIIDAYSESLTSIGDSMPEYIRKLKVCIASFKRLLDFELIGSTSEESINLDQISFELGKLTAFIANEYAPMTEYHESLKRRFLSVKHDQYMVIETAFLSTIAINASSDDENLAKIIDRALSDSNVFWLKNAC